MGLIQARAKLINGDGRVYVGDSNVLNVNVGGESTLELREGTFTTLSGGTLTFANGSSTTFTPGIATTYNVTAAQAGVANFRGTSPNYTIRGSSLVKVLKYPNNATIINHEDSRNLIQVPQILPPNVTVLLAAFNGCSSFNQSLNDWDVSKVTTMSLMFKDCINFNQPLGNWNTSKVTDMRYMFYGCANFNQNINNWDTSKVTNMDNMFTHCGNFNQPLNNWNVSQVTTMYGMFTNCTRFSQDLSSWCVTLITSMPRDFNDNAPLLTAAKLPVWGTCPIYDRNEMLFVANGNIGLAASNDFTLRHIATGRTWSTVYDDPKDDNSPLGLIVFDNIYYYCKISNPPSGLYQIIPKNANAGIGGLYLSGAIDEVVTWPSKGFLNPFYTVNNWVERKPENYVHCMIWSPSLTSVPDELHPSIKSTYSMFTGCTNFNHPNISKWNVGNVTDMTAMFSHCSAFNQPLNAWNVSNATTMNTMFAECVNFNQPLNNWNTSKVTDMASMFWGCTKFNQPLNNWNTSKVTAMRGMFFESTNFSQDLSKWCVPLITSKPAYFDSNASKLTAAKLPVWGTCPMK